jgi:signal transduction histidine kinase
VLGRPVAQVLAGRPEVVALLESALDGRERPGRAELRLRSADDPEPFTLGYTLLPVRDREGTVRGSAMLFRDLTPFERADEQARLAERLRALGEMAAGLAHEIRNPLASLEVLAGLLKRRVPDRADALELVEELTAEIRSLAAIVDAGLDFVRPVPLHREELDLAALLEESLARARARVPFDGVVERRIAPEARTAAADPERLRGALVNLIANALEAMAEGASPAPRLELAAWREDEGRSGVCIAVADSGPGVPAELRERIFHPFFTTRDSGSGVGLAEVQKVVAGHGGHVELDERPGGGSVFRIHLPDPPDAERGEAPGAGPADGDDPDDTDAGRGAT